MRTLFRHSGSEFEKMFELVKRHDLHLWGEDRTQALTAAGSPLKERTEEIFRKK